MDEVPTHDGGGPAAQDSSAEEDATQREALPALPGAEGETAAPSPSPGRPPSGRNLASALGLAHPALHNHKDKLEDVPAGEARDRAIARAVRCIRHPAVPAHMAETAHKVTFSGFAFGPNKRAICGRDTCPCGRGHEETVEHTFKECARSKRLWELVFTAWRAVTGEVKIRTDDGRAVLLGDRSGTWATEADEAEWAGLEEPWAICHKATAIAVRCGRGLWRVRYKSCPLRNFLGSCTGRVARGFSAPITDPTGRTALHGPPHERT